ncbi:MAG TPA: hypothetical protein VGE25_12730 [Sediminibacterium sp.]
MENRKIIITELQAVAPLIAAISQAKLYTVPEGYFASFPSVLTEKIRVEEMLAQATVPVYEVPDGYFASLPGEILSRIHTNHSVREELDEVAPLLNTIDKETPYQVPATYFAQADFARLARYQQPQARIVSLRLARKWVQYAAAALVTGVLVTGAFLYTDNPANIEETTHKTVDLSSELNKVSETELANYLDNPEHAAVANTVTTLTSEEILADVKNNLQQVSDEELKQYLTDNAEGYEVLTSE